eukprot:GHVT01067608.1.p3 GENE.GHVT01067608.1~~GHVT01067608.1.p3  ORF type:complete len:138 (+),score=31.16 GHVT01067608.1:989-1402(+)
MHSSGFQAAPSPPPMLGVPDIDLVDALIPSLHEGWRNALIAPCGRSQGETPKSEDGAGKAATLEGPKEPDTVSIILGPNMGMRDLFRIAAGKLNLPGARRAFSSSGEEIFSIELVTDEEVIYISAGQDFDKVPQKEG